MYKKPLLFLAIFALTVSARAGDFLYPTQSKTLKNGLKVIVCEKKDNDFVDVEVWYRVGSKDEWPGVRGMAHLFEHMMFRGTKKYPGNSIFENIDSVGGNNNAYTSYDRTVYHEYIPVSALEMALDMEADRMANLVVTQEILNTEREVVGEELRIGMNNWYRKMHAGRYPHLYPAGHPYEVDVIGFLEEITAFTSEQCMDFYNRFYSPDNAFLVIVGNVKSEEVFALAEKYFGPIAKQLGPKKKENTPDLTAGKVKQTEMSIDYPVQIYSYAFPRPASDHPDHAALDLLTELLFTDDNSILNKRLVKKDHQAYLIFSVSEGRSLYPTMGLIDFVMQAAPGNVRVKKAVREEINKAANGSFTQADIDRYIKSEEAALTLESYSSRTIAIRLGEAEYYQGDYRAAEDLLAPYRNVTPEDLKRVAATYFSEDRLQLINIKPQ